METLTSQGVLYTRPLRVLVACEFSGIVRDAFIARGHEAMSCDLEPSERPGPHYEGNVLDILGYEWDMMIAHPPCTYLAISGRAWFHKRQAEQEEAVQFVLNLANASHIPHIAIENPLSVLSTKWRKPDQIVEPCWFGHHEKKRTCWWLKNLPLLSPTFNVCDEPLDKRVQMMGESKNRARERSRTYTGMAHAMSEQWG